MLRKEALDKLTTSGSAWIGLNDNQTENIFAWEDTNLTLNDTGYTNWQFQGEKRNCVAMDLKDDDNGYWQARKCSQKRKFICEKGKTVD